MAASESSDSDDIEGLLMGNIDNIDSGRVSDGKYLMRRWVDFVARQTHLIF